MKLAIIPSWFPDKKNPTSGIFIYNQAKDLSAIIPTDVFVLRKGWPQKNILSDGSMRIISKKYLGLPNNSIDRLHSWAKRFVGLFYSEHQLQKYDIIHAHDHLAGYAALTIHRLYDIPYVVTLHNTNFLTRTFPQWKYGYIKEVINHASVVITVGKQLYSTIQTDYPEATVQYIPNYIDVQKFTLSEQKVLSPFKYLTVTSLFHKKRIDLMIRAFAEVHKKIDAELHIVGKGEDLSKLNRLVSDLNLDSRVIFHGSVPNHDIVSYYKNCHVYVSTSEVETFGVSVIEAMSCGLPVVTTKSGGPEFVVDVTSGLIAEVDNISESMIDIHENYHKYSAEDIRDKIVGHFSQQKIIPKIITVYNEVIN